MKIVDNSADLIKLIEADIDKAVEETKNFTTKQYQDGIKKKVYNVYTGSYGRHMTLHNAVQSIVNKEAKHKWSVETNINTTLLPSTKHYRNNYPFAYNLGDNYQRAKGYDAREWLPEIIAEGNAGNIFTPFGAFHQKRPFHEEAKRLIEKGYYNEFKKQMENHT